MSYILGSSASAESRARNMSWSLNWGEIAAPNMVRGGGALIRARGSSSWAAC